MMPESLFACGATYVRDIDNLPDVSVALCGKMIREVADHVAIYVEFPSFAALDERSNVTAIVAALAYSKEQFLRTDNEMTAGLRGAFAAVHMMTLHLVRGLEADAAIEDVAVLATQIYYLQPNQ